MLNTTPSPFADNPSTMSLNYTDRMYATESSETNDIKFGAVPVIIIGIIFAILTTGGNALVMVTFLYSHKMLIMIFSL
jgi:hypothetical protein